VRLSHSQLNHYNLCGQSYYRHYILEDRRPAGTAALRGSAVDAAVTMMLELKNTTEALSEADVDQAVWQYVNAADRGDVALTVAEKAKGSFDDHIVTVGNVACELSHAYRQKILPFVDPLYTQFEIEVPLSGPDDDSVLMYLDVVERDGTIRDTKTKNRWPGDKAADQSSQLALYAAGLEALTGVRSPSQKLDVLVPGKRGVRAETITAVHDADSQARATGRLSLAAAGVRAGSFQPASPDSWKCSENWCPYWRECAYGRGTAPTTHLISLTQED